MTSDTESERPDPDALLLKVLTQEKQTTHGKLRIYFGACAGVGKTYSMLTAANKLKSEGINILVGVVETHGRKETEVLLKELEVLPRKNVEYHGKQLAEFDIDVALQKKPQLMLVDELAHTNALGARHPKRWQDIVELLDAGINVFTTLNVQHLESLNDVVGSITGVRVAETVPDTIFDKAEEVVLVDIPADELLARLRAGKVYQAPFIDQAAHHFFRKGNLIALRELALRRTAERVGEDVQAYRIEQSISNVWKTDSLLLACIGPNLGSDHVVRSSARLALQLNADWYAIYVETPKLQRLSAKQRERILKTLKLASELGATTAVLAGDNVAKTIVNYARKHNFSKIILGRSRTLWWWHKPCIQQIARFAPDFDLLEIGFMRDKKTDKSKVEIEALHKSKSHGWRYAIAVSVSIITGLVVLPFAAYLDLANIAMLFLLTVFLVAIRFGRGPSIVATLVAILSFDFLFVPPRFSLAVSDLEYLLLFAVMLAVGLITGHLTSNLRYQALIASYRESRARALYELARDLSSALHPEPIIEISRNFIQRAFNVKATILLPDSDNHLYKESATETNFDLGIAQWAFDHGEPAGIGTDTLPANNFFYLPLVGPARTRGMLIIQPENRQWILIPEQRQQLDTFATLIALSLERVHYIQVAQNALVHIESERLRNTLLASLSRDLRQPIAALLKLSKSLVNLDQFSSGLQEELAQKLRKETLRLYALSSNLLDMARLQSGELQLNRQWHDFTEILSSALKTSDAKISNYVVKILIPENLPLIHLDAVLMKRVLCALIENASKYTPHGTQVIFAVEATDKMMSVNVYDDGPGLPPGQEEMIFEKFTRGSHVARKPGVGLGLAICRAIIEAHGGTIHAGHSPLGGASIVFSIPF